MRMDGVRQVALSRMPEVIVARDGAQRLPMLPGRVERPHGNLDQRQRHERYPGQLDGVGFENQDDGGQSSQQHRQEQRAATRPPAPPVPSPDVPSA